MLATKVLLSQGRQGVGTFYYANGAYYSGELLAVLRTAVVCVKNSNGKNQRQEWKSNVKEGNGRHTFDDGKVYDGYGPRFFNDVKRPCERCLTFCCWGNLKLIAWWTTVWHPDALALFLDKSKCCDGGKPELSKEENPVCGFRLSAAWL